MSEPHVIADDDPRLPTMADMPTITGNVLPSWWSYTPSQRETDLRLCRAAARHALAQTASLTNAEKRAIWLDGCLSGQQALAWVGTKGAESQSWFRYPDPAPPSVEYTLGDSELQSALLRLLQHDSEVRNEVRQLAITP